MLRLLDKKPIKQQEMENVEILKDENKEVEQAQALLQAKEQEKQKAFGQEYNELCKKYGYAMSAHITISAAGVVPNLEIVKI